YQPGQRCVTTYALTFTSDGAPPLTTIGVLEITPAGTAHRLYDDDLKLPWLALATDPNGMRGRFAALLGTPVQACVVTPVRYRPGVRCVSRYDIHPAAGARPLFGKRTGRGAEESMAKIVALQGAGASSPAMPRVLPPLAYWPDLHMLVQAEVAGGAELNDLAF